MENVFYELVIEGPSPVVKGFIYGLLAGSRESGTIFFSREDNIKTETFVEQLMEWVHLHEHLVHTVVEKGQLKISPNYQPKEELHPEGAVIEEYAPLHPYKLHTRRSVEGPRLMC